MSSVLKSLPRQVQLQVSPDKAEKLLRALSQMQACRHTRSFYQTTLSELTAVFSNVSYGAFLALSEEDGALEVVAKSGRVPKALPKAQISLLKQCLEDKKTVFSENTAALSLVHGDNRLGAILLKSNASWRSEDFNLLSQFALNAGRGLETAALLEEAEELAFQDTLTPLGHRVSFKKQINRKSTKKVRTDKFGVCPILFRNGTGRNFNICPFGYANGRTSFDFVQAGLKKFTAGNFS